MKRKNFNTAFRFFLCSVICVGCCRIESVDKKRNADYLDLREAVLRGSVDDIKSLSIRDTAVINRLSDEAGVSLLSWAISYDRPDEVIRLLLDLGANPNIGTVRPLFDAVRKGRPMTCQLLLDAGANPNAGVLSMNFVTPLHVAASQGDFGLVKMLVKYGARVEYHTSREGKTAAEEAIGQGHVEIAEWLENRPAESNEQGTE